MEELELIGMEVAYEKERGQSQLTIAEDHQHSNYRKGKMRSFFNDYKSYGRGTSAVGPKR
jgi:hypothetical protein